jgi:hypothetical protein
MHLGRNDLIRQAQCMFKHLSPANNAHNRLGFAGSERCFQRWIDSGAVGFELMVSADDDIRPPGQWPA